MANRRACPLRSTYYRQSPLSSLDEHAPLPFLFATITDSGSDGFIFMADGYVLITPQDGTITFAFVVSSTEAFADSGTETITFDPEGAYATADTGTCIIILFPEGRFFSGYRTTKQDGLYNVTIK